MPVKHPHPTPTRCGAKGKPANRAVFTDAPAWLRPTAEVAP
jgi:hypothetical protein